MGCLSAIIGGGIVGFPFAFYHCGVPMGVLMTLFVALSTHKAIKLLIITSHLIPGQPESYYEIAFMLLGRKSIFFISAIIAFVSLGLMMIYFIILGDIAKALVIQLILDEDYQGFLTSRSFYIAIFWMINMPFVLMKEVKEFKMVSYTLFIGIFAFLVFLGG
jgi:amino acid permease